MTTGVLLMAYGSPRSLDEVGPYLRDIRGGREPSPESIAELTGRYRRIGESSPLLEITSRQAAALGDALGDDFRVTVGMKHWHPYIAEAVKELGHCERIVGLALAPHYSKISIGGYETRLRDGAAAAGIDADVRMVPSWYDDPAFVQFAAGRLRQAIGDWPADGTRVFFTAHSLPERILREGDPYLDQLLESSRLVAEAAGVQDHEFAFQSASQTGEPWLGPDILQRLEAYADEGGKRAVVAPIGFVSDHLEILFDVDVECVEKAADVGLELRRTQSPNDDPGFVAALAGVVRRAAA